MNNWIDIPIVEAMEYFGGVLATALKWCTNYAKLIALIGLVWTGFKLVNSRTTIKDAWWDTLMKWVGFLVLMTIYPTMINAFSHIANTVGTKIGGGEAEITTNLKKLRDNLQKDVDIQRRYAESLNRKLLENYSSDLSLNGISFDTSDSYSEYLDKVEDLIAETKFSSRKDKKEAQKTVDSYRSALKGQSWFSLQTLKALNTVLVTTNIDGSGGHDMTKSYTKLNIWLKDKNNKDTYYLSPSAILRVSLLCSQVIYAKENTSFYVRQDEINEDPDLNFFEKGMSKMALTISRLWELILCFVCCMALILSTIFCIIQYSMTILEYTIVTAIGALFIPLMLFDGTKDIPKKLIPVLTNFMVKMIVITCCMMFVYYLFISVALQQISDLSGMNLVLVAEILFDTLVAFILTQNAPKIAQTILTGQPELSMGEFMQAGGTMAGAGALTGKAVRGTAKAGVAATRKGAQAAINTAGNIKQGISAAKSASKTAGSTTAQNAIKAGATKSEAKTQAQKASVAAGAKGLASGLFAKPTKDLANKVKEKGNSFLHGHTSSKTLDALRDKGSWNGNGSGGGGESGRKNPYDVPNNSTIQNSYKEDPTTKAKQNLTVKEFWGNKSNDGAEAGKKIGEQTAKKATAKIQQNKENKQSSSLPNNPNGERAHKK